MKYLKYMTSDESKLSDILGNSLSTIDDKKSLYKSNNGVYIYLPKGIEWYSFDELKEFLIIKEINTRNTGKYISKVYSIFEYGNISGRLDIEIIFTNDRPLLAILVESESEIIDNNINIMEDYKDTISFNLSTLI